MKASDMAVITAIFVWSSYGNLLGVFILLFFAFMKQKEEEAAAKKRGR